MMLRLTLASAAPPSAVGSANVRFPDRQVTAARWSPTMTLCLPLQKCESPVTGPATSGIVIGPLRIAPQSWNRFFHGEPHSGRG